MEYTGKHPLETYHPLAKINRGNGRYLSVYYGWWSFTFMFAEGEHLTPMLAESAKEQAKAILMLDDEDDGMDWHMKEISKRFTVIRYPSATGDRCSKRAVNMKGTKS